MYISGEYHYEKNIYLTQLSDAAVKERSDYSAPQERPASPTPDASKISRAFLSLFPYLRWTDGNTNSRIEPEEIEPAGREHTDLLKTIDQNGDGVCYAEIEKYVSGDVKIDPDSSIPVIYDELISKGSCKLPYAPVLLVLNDHVPEEIANMGFYLKKEEQIKRGEIRTFGISKNGELSELPTNYGGKKFCLIVFPKDQTMTLNRLYVESMISHELVHARQYFSGLRMEQNSIYYLMYSSGKFGIKEIQSVRDTLPVALGEIEAYKHELLNAIPCGDSSRLQYFALHINSQIKYVDRALELFKEKGANDLVLTARSMLAEVLSKEEIRTINQNIKTASEKCLGDDPVFVVDQ